MASISSFPLASTESRCRSVPTPARASWLPRQLERIHERALQRPTFAIAKGLEASQFWPSERLAALQEEKLERLIVHALKTCPYFRDRDYSVRPIQTLPLVTRDEVREHVEAMRWQGMPAKQMTDTTRGTRDRPLMYYWDRSRQAWDKANRLRGMRWAGRSPGRRELHLWPGDPPLDVKGRLMQWVRNRRDSLLRDVQVDCLRMSVERADAIHRTWMRFDPVCVTSYPSAIDQFLLHAKASGLTLPNASLRLVCLTGEVVHRHHLERVESMLGVPVFQNYGVQEVGAVAFMCKAWAWHVSAESAMVEFIRDGRQARPGELAEVVVTGLESRAMPIIRYCTGDVVEMQSLNCCCGRGLPVMPPALGRTGDFLQTARGDWIRPATVLATLSPWLEDGRFQVIQDRDGNVEVRVVTSERELDQVRVVVQAAMRGLLGCTVNCDVQRTNELVRTRFGKCRYVQSDAARPSLATG